MTTPTELNEGHKHEILDRVHVELSNLENNIGAHPYMLMNKEATTLYEQAQEKLAELYQLIGSGIED